MATESRKPIDLAERVASRRATRSTAAAAEGAWRRGLCLPRGEARAKAREWFERFPEAAHMTEIESWRELTGDGIEFVIRRLPLADCAASGVQRRCRVSASACATSVDLVGADISVARCCAKTPGSTTTDAGGGGPAGRRMA